MTLTGDSFSNTSSYPIQFRVNSLTSLTLSGNTATGRGPLGIRLYGDVMHNLSLPVAGLPYMVNGVTGNDTLLVDAGTTLTLPAGVVVKCGGEFGQLVVNGTLQAEGTVQNPVALNSAGGVVCGAIENTGGTVSLTNTTLDTIDPYGLCQTGGTTTLNGTTITGYVPGPPAALNPGAAYSINATGGALSVSNSTFIAGSSPTASSAATVAGIEVSGSGSGTLSVTGSSFSGGIYGVDIGRPSTVSTVTLTGNSFSNTSSYPILLHLDSITALALCGNTATGRGPLGVGLYGDVTHNLSLPLAGLPHLVNSPVAGLVDSPVTVDSGATLTLPVGVVINVNGEFAQLIVNGTLQAEGTPQTPVLLNSSGTVACGAIENTGGSVSLTNTTLSTTDPYGLCQTGGTTTLNGTTITGYRSQVNNGAAYGINATGGALSVSNSTFNGGNSPSFNTVVGVAAGMSGALSVSGSTFNGGANGVEASGPPTLTLTGNTFANTSSDPILLATDALTSLTASGNIVTGSGPVDIRLHANVSGKLTLPVAGLPYVVSGGGGLTVNSGATLTLNQSQGETRRRIAVAFR